MNLWGSVGPADSGISLRYSQFWLKFDAARDWFIIYDLCRRAINGGRQNMRIKLSFCLSSAIYSESKYSDIVPFFVAFALDERFYFLSPPQDPSYTLSDGVAPRFDNLKHLVSQSALPVESIPMHLLNVVETLSKKEKKRRVKEEYDAAIPRESSLVANLILHQWLDYESVDFHEQWFNKFECLQLVNKYIQSILGNIRLRDHVLRLQHILQHYVDVPIPATLPHKFSPPFIPRRSTAPPYTIRDALFSRANVPALAAWAEEPEAFLGDTLPPATVTTDTVAPVAPDNLKILIEELRHSQQSLPELYGNELNKSHCELVGHDASQSTRIPIPSHEILRLYHEDCSRKKDKLLSKISATLAPSHNMEKANAVAGLWPRITTRSLFRQLAQDRIGTLPSRWKAVITRYAVFFLKYQQSQRLLELSSSQKSEDLLREIESMRSDVLAESTPDWLLVQVRPLCCGRSE
jgi:hypothetical protein